MSDTEQVGVVNCLNAHIWGETGIQEFIEHVGIQVSTRLTGSQFELERISKDFDIVTGDEFLCISVRCPLQPWDTGRNRSNALLQVFPGDRAEMVVEKIWGALLRYREKLETKGALPYLEKGNPTREVQ